MAGLGWGQELQRIEYRATSLLYHFSGLRNSYVDPRPCSLIPGSVCSLELFLAPPAPRSNLCHLSTRQTLYTLYYRSSLWMGVLMLGDSCFFPGLEDWSRDQKGKGRVPLGLCSCCPERVRSQRCWYLPTQDWGDCVVLVLYPVPLGGKRGERQIDRLTY